MTIAELFVNIGVKGEGTAVKALTGVKTGLGEVASSGLAAKAALIAVMYGTEKLMSASAKSGTSLLQFATLTGLSSTKLQQWQYAARQTGVSAEEINGSLKSVQQSMTDMLTGKGAPAGMGIFARAVGFDPAKARDTFYVMEQLQKFAKIAPPDIGNSVLKSFGLGEGTISAMRRDAFNTKSLSKAPIYSDTEISKLNKVDVAWSNLGMKIEMAMGHLTSKHGLSLVNDISKVTTEVFKLIDALVKLADKLQIFRFIGTAFTGWAKLIDATSGGVGTLTGNVGKEGLMKGVGNTLESGLESSGLALKGLGMTIMDKLTGGENTGLENAPAPLVKPASGASGNKNVNIKQDLHFQHDGKDARKTGDSVHKAVQDALRQMSAQTQGS